MLTYVKITFFRILPFHDHQLARRWLVTAEARIPSRVILCGIPDERIGTVAGCSPGSFSFRLVVTVTSLLHIYHRHPKRAIALTRQHVIISSDSAVGGLVTWPSIWMLKE
jgi:hypothetical protein